MGTGDWTQEFWVYPLRQGNGERQNMVGNLTAWGDGYFITQISHTSYPGLVCVWWYNENDSAPVATSREPIPERVWTHIAVVRDGNSIRIFVNGKDDTTGQSPSSPSGSIDMSLSGMELGRHTGTNTYLNGYVSNLRIVKGTAVYTENFIPSKEPLTNISGTVLLCCQDQTSSTNYAVSPQPYGTITTGGDPTASSTAPTGSSGSVDFDGNDKLTLVSNSDFAFGEEPYTVEFWMYSDTVDQSCVIYNVGTTNGFVINRGSTIGINQYNVGNKVHTSDITDQAWVHYAFVREGTGTNGTKIYKDGTLDTTGTDATNWTTTHESAIGGNVANSQYFDGKISNFRIVKGKAVYTSNFTAPTRDLTAIDGTVLLCCQSATDETAAADIPSAITQSNDTKTFTFNPFDRNDDFVEGTESGYCVLNYLDNHVGTISNNGLKYANTGASNVSGTVAMPRNSGKFYWEIQVDKDGGGVLGIGAQPCDNITNLSDMNKIFGYSPNGSKYENSTQTSYGNTYRNGDMISVLFDTDLEKLEFWKNGVSQGLAFQGGDDDTGGVIFDGTDDYLTLASSADLVMRGDFTMECWFYASSVTGVHVILNGRGLASSGGPVIYTNGNSLVFDHGGAAVVTASSAVSAGTWYHVAGTREGTTWTLYKNGASVGSATNTTSYSSNTAFAIGNSHASELFSGFVSNVRVVAACVYTSAFDVPTKELKNIPHTILLCCQSRTSATASTVAPGSITASGVPSPRSCEPFDDKLDMETNLYFPQVHCNALDLQFNFGQNPYRFTPPDGYKSVCLSNISDPATVRSDHYVGITTWSGEQSGSGQALRRIPLDFQPDFVWIKQLNQAYSSGHQLYDSVRGAGNENELDTSSTQYMGEGNPNDYGWVEKFDGVGGFTTKGGGTDYDYVNKSGVNYVAWCWKAGGNKNTFNVDGVGYASAAAAGLTAGPTGGSGTLNQANATVTGCSIGTKQGFSIIRYNSTNVTGSVNFPHGLTKQPQIIITKNIATISTTGAWGFYYNLTGAYDDTRTGPNTRWVTLNENIVTGNNNTGRWVGGTYNAFAYLGRDHVCLDQNSYANAANVDGKSMIAYIWHNVPGLQKFGTYEGNGVTDGPFINCGFRPALVICRRIDSTNDWQITDDTRSPFNIINKGLYANLDVVQNTTDRVDYLSNGFKIRAALNENNPSGGTVLYMAWAKSPFNNMYGGQSNAR